MRCVLGLRNTSESTSFNKQIAVFVPSTKKDFFSIKKKEHPFRNSGLLWAYKTV